MGNQIDVVDIAVEVPQQFRNHLVLVHCLTQNLLEYLVLETGTQEHEKLIELFLLVLGYLGDLEEVSD